ncbi:hypothetical protein AnigIFM50267_003135 [Aspergillus niger]|nr:hypothetical protein AnigIFM50267_003135 [Aspergillus niger]
MATPSILLQTKQNGLFPSDHGYSDVSDRDLLALVELCRKTTDLMEAELVKRQIWINSSVSTVVDECFQKIRSTLSTVKTLQRLQDNNIALVENAVNTMMNPPPNRDSKLYRTFLTDILRIGHRGLVVLCAASLGKQRIVSMNKQERLHMIQCLKVNKAIFDFPILEQLATVYKVPHYAGMATIL